MKPVYFDDLVNLCSELSTNENKLLPLCAAENVISPFSKIPLDTFLQEKLDNIQDTTTKHLLLARTDTSKIINNQPIIFLLNHKFTRQEIISIIVRILLLIYISF